MFTDSLLATLEEQRRKQWEEAVLQLQLQAMLNALVKANVEEDVEQSVKVKARKRNKR